MTQTVCVLVISHKYGQDVHVCADSDTAYCQLGKHVDKWWNDSMTVRIPGGEDVTPERPGDTDEKIELYFEAMDGRESYETFPDEEVIVAEAPGYDAILGIIATLDWTEWEVEGGKAQGVD